MSKISYNNFGLAAKASKSLDLSSGRFKWMKKFYPEIIRDISNKLDLNKNDDLLDIGCGSAKITFKLSKLTKSVTAIDHPDIIKSIKYSKIKFIKGSFLDIKIPLEKFNKILIYSLIHYLENKRELFLIIDKSLKLLKKNGLLLIGDIPNLDKKKRFKKSLDFKKIDLNWNNNFKKTSKLEKKIQSLLKKDNKVISITDNLIQNLLKKYTNSKNEVFLLMQNKNLPMNNTRVDILIKKF